MADFKGLIDAAQELELHVNTLYKWARAGLVTARREGPHRRWEVDMADKKIHEMAASKWDKKKKEGSCHGR